MAMMSNKELIFINYIWYNRLAPALSIHRTNVEYIKSLLSIFQKYIVFVKTNYEIASITMHIKG